MNKIVDGKKYDTKTAKPLVTWDNGYSVNDFNYISETLYQKKTSEYFLHGRGNASTQYAQRCPDGWTTGELIFPLTERETKQWVENHFDGDTYESIFGSVEE